MIILALSLDVDSFISRAALVPPATHRAVIDISSSDRERFISTSLPRGLSSSVEACKYTKKV